MASTNYPVSSRTISYHQSIPSYAHPQLSVFVFVLHLSRPSFPLCYFVLIPSDLPNHLTDPTFGFIGVSCTGACCGAFLFVAFVDVACYAADEGVTAGTEGFSGVSGDVLPEASLGGERRRREEKGGGR